MYTLEAFPAKCLRCMCASQCHLLQDCCFCVQDMANATLCVDPARAGARVTVFNGTNDVMQPVDVAATAAVSTFASTVPGR